MHTRRLFAAAVAGLALAFAGGAQAQSTADYTTAPAGAYQLDANHTAVLARVPHFGFSYEVFRFAPSAGELTWDPAAPAQSSVNVTVNVGSIQTPVEGFGAELASVRFLDAGAHPTATFVSTAFRQIDATHGEVDGNFTLRGVTKPVTFQIELVGAGPGPRGGHLIGFHATTRINNADFGLPSFIAGQSEIVIDAEFKKA